MHPNLQNQKLDLEIFQKKPEMMLLYNVFKAGDGTGVGYVGIKDAKNKYPIGSKVFYIDSMIEEYKNQLLGTQCGIISCRNVDTNVEFIYNQIGKTVINKPKKEIDENYNYSKLSKKEKAIFQAYLKIRIIECERKQNISPLEVFLLDTIEMNKRRWNQFFDLERNIKDLCKWYGFKPEKLKSGIQRRRQCRRWAKKDFVESNGVFISEHQYTKSGF
jgi:hypothetical protein